MVDQEIIKTALLGTDNYQPKSSVLLAETEAKIDALETDKEDRFLKMAITSLLFEECGRTPVALENKMAECLPETLQFIDPTMHGMVRSALLEKDEVFFAYLIFLVCKNQQVLSPELVPDVLDKALENKKLSDRLVRVCGQTGKWLSALNERWSILMADEAQGDIWETGNVDNRKSFLKRVRKVDPEEAIRLIEVTFQAENAATRLSLLEELHENLSLTDEPFLQKLLKDKSQKVKETALGMLRRMQGSTLNENYLGYILSVISVREERYLVVTKKKVVKIADTLPTDAELSGWGIDKVSSVKGMPDHMYVIGQILRDIDPTILAKNLAVTDEQLIRLFLESDASEYLIPFLVTSASAFKNKAWSLALLKHGERDITLLGALEKEERTAFYHQFLEGNLQGLLGYLLDQDYSDMQMSTCKSLLVHLSNNPYHISQPVYRRLALHLPDDILPQLKLYAQEPGDDYQKRYFRTQVIEMMRMIELKTNVN